MMTQYRGHGWCVGRVPLNPPLLGELAGKGTRPLRRPIWFERRKRYTGAGRLSRDAGGFEWV
jgi:hypothetical protein